MRDFEKITIQEMSKEDMLLIIEALDYTGTKTNIEDFIILKDNFVTELSSLADIPESEFIEYLKNETQSL
ncbi:MAG: hypothetical protein GX787_02280 [Tissierellia bacterium]|jgi:hypothetical protein|nr:hypothetical protein [Tissierellia bacterium]